LFVTVLNHADDKRKRTHAKFNSDDQSESTNCNIVVVVDAVAAAVVIAIVAVCSICFCLLLMFVLLFLEFVYSTAQILAVSSTLLCPAPCSALLCFALLCSATLVFWNYGTFMMQSFS